MQCSICGNSTLLIGTLHIYTTYRCEDKDYIQIKEEGSERAKGYFEIFRYCSECLMKYCVGKKGEKLD